MKFVDTLPLSYFAASCGGAALNGRLIGFTKTLIFRANCRRVDLNKKQHHCSNHQGLKQQWNMALMPEGKKLYVANGRSDNIFVMYTVQQQGVQTIAVAKLPWRVKYVYVD